MYYQWLLVAHGDSTRHTRDMNDHRIIRNLIKALREDRNIIVRLAEQLSDMQLKHGVTTKLQQITEWGGLRNKTIKTSGRTLQKKLLYAAVRLYVSANRYPPYVSANRYPPYGVAAKHFKTSKRTIKRAVGRRDTN